MLSKLFCRFLFQLFLNKCKGKSKSHIAFLKICNCLFDRLRSCIHVKLLKIVSHLIKFCGMMLVMLPFFLMAMYEKNGQPLEKIQQDTERDNYLTAQQAKEYGLIDEVIAHR